MMRQSQRQRCLCLAQAVSNANGSNAKCLDRDELLNNAPRAPTSHHDISLAYDQHMKLMNRS